MAIVNKLQVFDEQGNLVDYDILASDVKFSPDGKDLPTKLAEMEEEIGEGGYTPPVGGIPKSDLASDVQTSLGKADTALQSFTETDPTVPQWAKQPSKPSYTAREVGAMPDTTEIPSKTSDLVNDSGFLTQHQDVSGKADKSDTYTKAQVDTLVADAGKVKSVSVNGTKHTPDANGDVDLGTVVGEKGEKGDKGDTGSVVVTDGVAQISIINDLVTGGTGDALSAEMGKYLKMLLDSYESRMDALEESGAVLMNMSGKTLVISRITDPIVLAGNLTRSELNAVAGGSSIPSVFFISGRNLEGNIGIALSDSTNFTLSASSLTPVDGKVVTTMVSVTYTPASGAAADTTHNCNVVISYDGTTQKTMSLSGTVAASASVSLTPSSLTLKTVENGQTSGTIHVGALALSGNVTLELSGSGLSFADDDIVTTKTIARADAEDGIDVDIYYTAGASDVTGTLTASSSGVTSVTATINGVVAVPLEVGSYFDVPIAAGGAMRFTVTSGTNVSVKGVARNGTNPTSTLDAPLTIPATINDGDAVAVYNSSGTAISASNVDYSVKSIAANGFEKALGTNLRSIIISEGITSIENGAFGMGGDYSNRANIQRISLPATLSSIGSGNAFTFSNHKNLATIKFKSSCSIPSYAFSGCTGITKLVLEGGVLENNAFSGCTQFSATSGTKPIVVYRATTVPTYRSWAVSKPFPENSSNKVYATLYCSNPSAFSAAGWNVFDEILDISNYEE